MHVPYFDWHQKQLTKDFDKASCLTAGPCGFEQKVTCVGRNRDNWGLTWFEAIKLLWRENSIRQCQWWFFLLFHEITRGSDKLFLLTYSGTDKNSNWLSFTKLSMEATNWIVASSRPSNSGGKNLIGSSSFTRPQNIQCKTFFLSNKWSGLLLLVFYTISQCVT